MKQVRDQLPKHLIAKLSKMLSAPNGKPTLGVVAESISSFVETEQKKSHAVGAELADQLCASGLAVAGSAATIEALQRGQVDMLVLAEGYRAEPGLRCETCYLVHAKQDKPTTCSTCGSSDLRDIDMTETYKNILPQKRDKRVVKGRLDQKNHLVIRSRKQTVFCSFLSEKLGCEANEKRKHPAQPFTVLSHSTSLSGTIFKFLFQAN